MSGLFVEAPRALVGGSVGTSARRHPSMCLRPAPREKFFPLPRTDSRLRPTFLRPAASVNGPIGLLLTDDIGVCLTQGTFALGSNDCGWGFEAVGFLEEAGRYYF
jgi:hypothetical protein